VLTFTVAAAGDDFAERKREGSLLPGFFTGLALFNAFRRSHTVPASRFCGA
jgi:hypothetical protein